MPVPNKISPRNTALMTRSMTGQRQIRSARKQPARSFGPLLWGAAILLSAPGCQWAASGQNATGARLYEQGQYSAALQQFQKVIATDPDNADGYYNLAATNHRLGLQRNDPAMLNQAESLYNQCLDHAPNHVECHRGLAVLLIDTGRPDRAFALMKNWAAQNPTFSEPRVELARLYEEANDPETALKYLEDAVQKDANNARAWLALGQLREQDGRLCAGCAKLPAEPGNQQHAADGDRTSCGVEPPNQCQFRGLRRGRSNSDRRPDSNLRWRFQQSLLGGFFLNLSR